jgi:hypothetical protein
MVNGLKLKKYFSNIIIPCLQVRQASASLLHTKGTPSEQRLLYTVIPNLPLFGAGFKRHAGRSLDAGGRGSTFLFILGSCLLQAGGSE